MLQDVYSFLEETKSDKIDYLLLLIVGAMILNVVSSFYVARQNKFLKTQILSEKIRSKIFVIALLIYCLFLAPVFPDGSGVLLLYTIYGSQLYIEITEVIENYKRLGIDIDIDKDIEQIKKIRKKE